ncbi:hypothetical protein CAC42_7244 [Sphaceloma murrayae]|uniref:High-affinity nicotinic acid transporter n=1 Tax=Sphaceloma murrayae TaxID=2082308 RepID=A0A2K1QQJ0_9PEZI|nr:hypothetical protein CAC42_7244 [Sphaceloma murrayae]
MSKASSIETASAGSTEGHVNWNSSTIDEKAADGALVFLRQNASSLPLHSSDEDLRRVRRKVDYRIIPLLALIYFLNFIDKILLNYANVMGISQDLKLRGNDFSNASSAFWIAVLLAEISNNCPQDDGSASVWPAGAYVRHVTAGTSNYHGLLATRIFSGAFESTVPPALMQITGRWYIRSELISRVVLWYLGTATGFIFFTDFQLWAQWLIMLLNGGGGGVITAYSSTLIRSFGYVPKQAALLNMGSGGVGITACVLSTIIVRKTNLRWAGIVMVAIPTIIGAGLMSFLSSRNQSGSLAGIYLVNSSIAMVPFQFSWMITNVSGQTKRAIAFTVLNAAFALGNIIGPQTFQARDAPTYIPARLSMFTMQCIIVLVSITLAVYYKRENRRRDAVGKAVEGSALSYEEAFQEETDKKRPNFRYAC